MQPFGGTATILIRQALSVPNKRGLRVKYFQPLKRPNEDQWLYLDLRFYLMVANGPGDSGRVNGFGVM